MSRPRVTWYHWLALGCRVPDFGPGERVLSAYHEGEALRDDAVRYGLGAVRPPRSVPRREQK